MITVAIIHTDGRVERVVAKADLSFFQKSVGGYIEVILLGDCDMYINEDGVADDLSVNPRATRFAKKRLDKIGRRLLTVDGWVFGPVVLTGKPNDDGDPTSFEFFEDAEQA